MSLKQLDGKLQAKLRSWSEHVYLLPLFEHALDLKAKTMLELGVEYGKSTLALLAACTLIEGAYLWSVDIHICITAQKMVSELGLTDYWDFTAMDDIEYAQFWNKSIDLLFIDTSHTLPHTRQELETYHPFLKKGGHIILHDSLTSPGVNVAIHEFLSIHAKWKYWETPNTRHGLGVLQHA